MAQPPPTPGIDPGRQIEILRAALERSERNAREIDHRAANSLQIAATFLRLQRAQVTNEEARSILETAGLRIAAIARAHRYFHTHPDEDAVDLAAILADLAGDLSTGMGMKCRVEVEPARIAAGMARQVVVMVNELVVNAHKHAYDGHPGGTVLVSGGPDGDRLRLTVADLGPGLPDGFDPEATTGLGIQVMRAILRQLGGDLSARTEGGARFTMTLPLA